MRALPKCSYGTGGSPRGGGPKSPSAQKVHDALADSELLRSPVQMGWLRLWALTSLSFAYGFMLADQGMLLAPLEAERLFPEQASLGLGGMAVCCGVAQLVGPVAGHWSDQYSSRFGRRRPCLVKSTGAVVALTLALWTASQLYLPWLFMCVFLCQQIAWNVILSVTAGLVPDLVLPEQRGIAGGATAANTLAGALAALLTMRFSGHEDFHNQYTVVAALGVACCILVCMAAQEKSSERAGDVRRADWGMSWHQLRGFYGLDVRLHPEFAKLLVSKTLYCSSVMVKGFLFFFVQDTFKLNDAMQEQSIVGDAAIAAEFAAAFSAVAAMIVLDANSRSQPSAEVRMPAKGVQMSADSSTLPGPAGDSALHSEVAVHSGPIQARFAALAGAAWMGFMWFGPVLVGRGVLRDASMLRAGSIERQTVAHAWAPCMAFGTFVWGLGQGVYLVGDQTLSYALLPDADEAARLLGLTSVCAAIGAMLGGWASGAILHIFGSSAMVTVVTSPAFGDVLVSKASAAPGYKFIGYAMMFMMATCLSWSASAALATVRVRPASECARASIFP